ncbi:MAG: hypothetical protein ACHQDE_09555, partial [Acidimicrobiia bacterium]
MLTLVIAIVGPLACAGLVTAGRRAGTANRVRDLGPRARWRLPSRVRVVLEAALRDADVIMEPEPAVELWAAGVLGAAAMA